MLAQTFQDIRYAFRMLAKNPGFACVVVLTLALGIGANASIFSVMDKVLMQSLPVSNPEQLVVLATREVDMEQPGIASSFSYPMYQDLRDKNTVFSGVIARGGAQMNVSYGDQNERVRGELVSGNFFDALGVKPWVGRFFTQQDDVTPGAHPVVVLSYGFWERRFGKDPGVLGKTILVNEHALTVLGVTPPGFYGVNLSNNPDIRIPLMMTPVFNPLPPTRLQSRTHQWLTIMARRKADVTMDQAQASLSVLYHQIREFEVQRLSSSSAYDREKFLAGQITVLPGAQGFQTLQREMRTSLLLLFGATCAVLLILCANLANLMMARATARAPENAVRLALGAGRVRLLRQWLTEGLVLSVIGGAVAVLVALWLKAGLLSVMPSDYKTNLGSSGDWRLYGFVLLVAIVVGLIFSLAPAIQAARQPFAAGMHTESRSFTASGKLFSLRSGLVLIQVALSLPLLVSAGLLLKTLQNLRGLDTGFAKENVLFASVNPALNGYSPEKTHAFYDELLNRTRSIPGVVSASLATDSPISGGWDQNGIVVEGYTPRQGEKMGCDVTIVSTDYFKTLGIPLVAGRDFSDQDRAGSPKVALINEKMAGYFFGAANPIGKHIGLEDKPDITIVGVVKDAKYISLRQEMRRHFYIAIAQEPRLFDMALHVKTQNDPASVAEQIRTEVNALDPHLPLYNIKTLDKEIDESLVQERLVTWLSSAFGVLATLLTALGLYGVLTFSVARRTREIGIRVALGAQRRDVMKLVMTRGVVLIGLGVVVGLGASFAFSSLMKSLLFGVQENDPLIVVSVAIGLTLVGLVACYLPARRATKVDPLVALRDE